MEFRTFNFRAFAPRLVVSLCILCFAWGDVYAKQSASENAAIASAHHLATEAGYEILDQGGNAFDAAVAVTAALAVVEPFSSGIGGGGFWLLYRASDGKEVMLDGRETAPLNATEHMFLNAQGKSLAKASLEGAKAAAIPGTPAALVWLAENYGALSLRMSLAPAIRLAKQGFAIDVRYSCMARSYESLLLANPDAARIFLVQNKPPLPGFKLRQSGLAKTLESIARFGKAGFYQGSTARVLVAAVKKRGGIWQRNDLKNYRVIERIPVKFDYHGATITSAALPSSGGLTLGQSLNILERFPLLSLNETEQAHYVIEAMRRAYHDRARYLGDPDYVSVAQQKLLSKEYAAIRAATIDPHIATPSDMLELAPEPGSEGPDTTHFSIVDQEGNRVAATLSINTPFGSGLVAGRTGVLLNNHMDDFSTAPGIPNAYGLVGGKANAIAPGKRPLSSMSPTFVEDQKGVLIFGTPGGPRIISMVLLEILDYVHRPEKDILGTVSLPRYHHQYLPDILEVEPNAFSAEWIEAIKSKGYLVRIGTNKWGNMQAVFFDKTTRRASATNDPRGNDQLCYK